jgi:hypothetical protein
MSKTSSSDSTTPSYLKFVRSQHKPNEFGEDDRSARDKVLDAVYNRFGEELGFRLDGLVWPEVPELMKRLTGIVGGRVLPLVEICSRLWDVYGGIKTKKVREIASRTQDSSQLILDASELEGSPKLQHSSDTDYLKTTVREFGATLGPDVKNSKSTRQFEQLHKDSEVVQTKIQLTVFKSIDAATQEMAVIYDSKFDNPESEFYSDPVDIPTIGDQSFCYRWSSFPPTIVSRVGNVVFEVECSILNSAENRFYHDDSTLARAVDVARKQQARSHCLPAGSDEPGKDPSAFVVRLAKDLGIDLSQPLAEMDKKTQEQVMALLVYMTFLQTASEAETS